ncbi:MAG: TonB-dependent receptor [Bryobacter sp.]|nr:TonB-dependent receptor [Bryobacter sp.]
MLNEFRFLFANRPISNGVLNPDNPNINVQGIASFNGNSNGNRSSNERGFQFINNTTWIKGRHTVKFGVDILPVNFKERLTNINGQFVFGGLPAVAGVRGAISPLDQFLNTERGLVDPATSRPFSYTRFTQSIGREFYDASVLNQGYFIQDDIRLTANLKLNIGLRYEYFLRPDAIPNPDVPATATIPQDSNNWAPRAGLAWDLTGDGKTVLRTGGGIYYNTTVAQTWNNFFRGNGVEVFNINVSPADQGAPAFTRGRVEPITGARRPVTDVRAVSDDFQDVMVYNYFATLERSLGAGWGVSLTYQGNWGRDLPVSFNTNLRNTGNVLADGRTQWSSTNRPDPRFGNIFVSNSVASMNYNGMVVQVTKRMSRGLSLQASHQYSKSRGFAFVDDFIGFGILRSPTDPQTLAFDGGPGDFDMRNRFLLTAVYEPNLTGGSAGMRNLINGWILSSRTIAQSGFSHDGTTGRDDNGDTVLNDRPVGNPYNNFKLPNYVTVDFRLTRTFTLFDRQRFEVIGEVFNVANKVNITNVNRVWGINATPNANFRQGTSAENARQFQLALRWSF